MKNLSEQVFDYLRTELTKERLQNVVDPLIIVIMDSIWPYVITLIVLLMLSLCIQVYLIFRSAPKVRV